PAGKGDGGLVDAREIDLRLLGGELELAEGTGERRVAARQALVELGERPVDDRPVEVAPAEEVVAVVPDDTQEALAGPEERRGDRSAAEIVDQPAALVGGGPARGDRRGDRLLDELDALEARESRRLGGGRVLRQLEERGHRDDGTLGKKAELLSHVG